MILSVEASAASDVDAYTVLAVLLMVGVVTYLLWRMVSWIDRGVTALLHPRIPGERRDPTRTFSAATKRQAAELAGHRCEGTRLLRCRHRGEDLHGDHWYPHARGGSTDPANLVMLCPRCNRRKSDKIPSHLATAILYRRRRSYMPPGRMRPGQWRPRRNRPEPTPAVIAPPDDF